MTQHLRWTSEELNLIGRKEAELLNTREPRFMNIELAKFFRNRTAEAIKKAHQEKDYRALVGHLLATLSNTQNSPHLLPLPPTHLAPIPLWSERTPLGHLLDYILAVPAGVQTTPIQGLLEIMVNAEEKRRLTSALEIANFLISNFQINATTPRQLKRDLQYTQLSNRKRRRLDYARTQHNFRKHKGRCIREILQIPRSGTFPEETDMI